MQNRAIFNGSVYFLEKTSLDADTEKKALKSKKTAMDFKFFGTLGHLNIRTLGRKFGRKSNRFFGLSAGGTIFSERDIGSAIFTTK